MSVEKMKVELERLDALKWDLKSAVEAVNHITRDIKYDNTPMEIYMHVEQLADEHGIDVKYEVNTIREKVNELESAIYELVSPFESELRDAEYEHDDLEYEIEEVVNGND